MSTTRRRGKVQIGTTVLVVVCFLLQHLLVPIHLAWNHHTYPGEQDHRSAAHQGDFHGGSGLAQHYEPRSDSDHQPHPADDHLQQLEEPARPLTIDSVAWILAPAIAVTADPLLPPALTFPEDGDLRPRPPPPRSLASPRAPPVAS